MGSSTIHFPITALGLNITSLNSLLALKTLAQNEVVCSAGKSVPSCLFDEYFRVTLDVVLVFYGLKYVIQILDGPGQP